MSGRMASEPPEVNHDGKFGWNADISVIVCLPCTRDLSGIVDVDGQTYRWELRREPQWCTTDGWQGMLVSVALDGGNGKEALLQFPAPKWGKRRSTPHRQRPQVQITQVAEAIRSALAVGWEPDTRGKAFHIDL